MLVLPCGIYPWWDSMPSNILKILHESFWDCQSIDFLSWYGDSQNALLFWLTNYQLLDNEFLFFLKLIYLIDWEQLFSDSLYRYFWNYKKVNNHSIYFFLDYKIIIYIFISCKYHPNPFYTNIILFYLFYSISPFMWEFSTIFLYFYAFSRSNISGNGNDSVISLYWKK